MDDGGPLLSESFFQGSIFILNAKLFYFKLMLKW